MIYHVASAVHHVTPLTRGTITEYHIPTANSDPWGITEGPDKNLWFTSNNGKVGNITLNGTETVYQAPHGYAPTGITAGSDGNLWFVDQNSTFLASITPGGVITEYSVPTPGSNPTWITSGPNGTLWFTEYAANKLGEFTISTHSFKEYPLPSHASACPTGITGGLNGTIWFADLCAGRIGFIVAKTGKITVYSPPNISPFYIALGSDNGYWFTTSSGRKVGHSSASGKSVEYPDPTDGDPYGCHTDYCVLMHDVDSLSRGPARSSLLVQE